MATTRSKSKARKRLSMQRLAEVIRAQQAVIDALPPMEESAEIKRAAAKACCDEHLGE